MNVAASSDSRHRNQDFDLNITSIIDSFTVLIAFMLASASFLSVSVFDAGVSAAGSAPADKAPPSVSVELAVNKGLAVAIKLTGKVNSSTIIPAKDGKLDYETLSAQLAGVKAKYTDVSAATLVADTTVEYREVIRTMEVTRKSLPYVLLGGF